ncbi:MAG: Quinoprotein glucose dehydrogenase B [Verrucomicrobia subdivision 3 bacterium]|nr:Quinoprotein glucose dehydrogenase B [Limisphaerales bacterium]MCS1415557.1 Quinoprotein glucose dehydrogenase B [Limisphaerales bacterium]
MNRSSRLGLILGASILGQVIRVWGIDPLPQLELEVAFPRLTFDRPVTACSPPSGDQRLYLVEQKGRILILPQDRELDTVDVFLDITDRKPYVENEEGLLGLCFHPQYRSNGKFYVYYTQHQPRRSVLSQFQHLATDANRVDPVTERVLLEVPQPYGNHNSGTIAFGPDGHLYIGLGDGGSANDPHDNGQNLRSLLGKILRVDVNRRPATQNYGIPLDNPFVGAGSGIRPEIWAFGFRNPWCLSFDPKNGSLWMADVGQNKWEEINLVVRGGNYGWNTYEGFHLFKEPASKAVNTIFPVMEYPHSPQFNDQAVFPHSPGLSITGGHVYRGARLSDFDGVYFYGDFAMGTLWGLRFQHGKITHLGTVAEMPLDAKPRRSISGFGRDADGEIYILSFDGRVYSLEPETKG